MGQPVRFDPVSALIFRVGGVGIGLDTDLISGMTDAQAAREEDAELVAMDELFGLDAERGMDSFHPKVLWLKGGYLPVESEDERGGEGSGGRTARRVGIVVNEPEEIVDIPVDAMRPLPPLVARGSGANGLWAVALMPGEMILMMDVRKMIGNKMPEVRWRSRQQVAAGS